MSNKKPPSSPPEDTLNKKASKNFLEEQTPSEQEKITFQEKKSADESSEKDLSFQGFAERMTTISRQQFDQITDSSLSASQAAALLKKNAVIRTLWDSIMKYSDTDNASAVQKRLTTALISYHPDDKKDTIQRRVRDWKKSAHRTIAKETALELCFALELSVAQANDFLAEVTDEGFHWRNPQELICIWGLEQGLSYMEVCALQKRISDLTFDNPKQHDNALTDVIRGEFPSIRTPDDLIAYIRNEQSRLGYSHLTAYSMFEQMLNSLLKKDEIESCEDEEETYEENEESDEELTGRMSVRKILRACLFRKRVPNLGKISGESASIQRMISKNWPTEKEISQMRTQTIDVQRKTLILLFLATNGITEGADDYDDYDYDSYGDYDDYDEPMDEDEFESSLVRLNTMLHQSGMRLIDPRLPFDWMVLYILRSSDEMNIDNQIRDFLNALFTDDDPEDGDDS